MLRGIACFAVRARPADAVKPFAAGTNDKLTDTARIGSPLGILRREPFVNVIVAGKHHIGSVGIEDFE